MTYGSRGMRRPEVEAIAAKSDQAALTGWTALEKTLPQPAPGDTFTIGGMYHRRTLWQWLTRQPRELRRYVVRND